MFVNEHTHVQGMQTMFDESEDRLPADNTRVNVHEECEVRYWCKELRCSPA